MRVGVMGAGIMGASAARALAERGHEVVLFERFRSGHDFGSSHGRSRIVRKAYPDPLYTAIMDEGYALWHELQARARRPLIFEPGLLYFGSFESETLREVMRGLQQLSVPHDLLDHEQVRRIFPPLVMRAGEIGVFTPEAGWVDAGAALAATIEGVVSAGGVCIEEARMDPHLLETQFDRYVLCPGAWIREFVDLPVRVTLQTFGYAEKERLVTGPVWIDDCPEFFYGFPSEPGATSFKIGVHQAGPAIDPEYPDRTPWPEHATAIRDEAARRFGSPSARFAFKGCLYTRTVDEDFLFGRHGERGYFASACSGHGFKFGPWMGRKLADFVEDRDAPENHPRFCWPKPRLEA